jgi:hypothetical protein
MGIIAAKEIFGRDAPPALQEIIEDGEESARRILERNSYAKFFTKVFQERPWEA